MMGKNLILLHKQMFRKMISVISVTAIMMEIKMEFLKNINIRKTYFLVHFCLAHREYCHQVNRTFNRKTFMYYRQILSLSYKK